MNLPTTSVPANFSAVVINGTNVNGCPNKSPEAWAYTVLHVYILLISVLGIIFNIFVLMVFCLHKKPCTVAEIYLSNLAAADLILVSFLPFWAVSASARFNWPFGSALCRLVNLSIIMNVYCSIYFLVLVSIDRYVALVHPLSRRRILTPKYAKLACLLVWGLGLLLSTPTIIYRQVEIQPNFTKCFLNYPDLKVLLLFEAMLTIFSFIIPIPIISYCTWKIIQALNNRLIDGSNNKTQKMEQKATTLVLAVLLAFLICWVPFHLMKIIELLLRAKVLTGCRVDAVLGICKQIFTYFAFFNSVLNPILYVIVGKKFQKKVKELFKLSTMTRGATFSLTSTRTYLRSIRSQEVSN